MSDDQKGVWLDKDTGMVVTSPPRRGRQLVAPGHEVGKREQALIERFRADYATASESQASVETAAISNEVPQKPPVKPAPPVKAPKKLGSD